MQTSTTPTASKSEPSASGRMAFFDVVRGFSVISMVLFHLCYDLRYLYGYNLAFFQPPFQDIWRCSISWTFLFIAGCMCTFSRNGLKRALRYLGVALAVYLVTTIAAVDTPISFGIIFCMGGSTLVEYLLQRLGCSPAGIVAACVLFACFLFLQGVPHGYVGIGSLRCALPASWYATPYLSWLGLPGPNFASGDYYPLIPYTFMFLVGTSVAHYWRAHGYPSWMAHVTCKPLEAVGKLALPIYVVHQPLLLAVLQLIRPL